MRVLAACTALAAVFAFPSCSSEAASPAGMYTVTIDTSGMSEEAAAAIGQAMTFNDWNLNADGTWDMSTEVDVAGQKMKSAAKGTWKHAGGEIILTTTHQDGKEVEAAVDQKGTYKDGAFSLELEQDGQKLKLDMKKKG